MDFLLQFSVQGEANQFIDDREKCSQSFTGTCWRTEKQMFVVHDGWDGQFLRAREV